MTIWRIYIPNHLIKTNLTNSQICFYTTNRFIIIIHSIHNEATIRRLNRGDCMSEQENPYETIKNNNHNNNNNNKEKYEMNVNEDTF